MSLIKYVRVLQFVVSFKEKYNGQAEMFSFSSPPIQKPCLPPVFYISDNFRKHSGFFHILATDQEYKEITIH